MGTDRSFGSVFTHPTLLTFIQNLAVIIVVAVVVYRTENATALLGLLLLSQMPVLASAFRGDGHSGQDDEGFDAPGHEPTIGFTAKLREPS